MSVPLPFATLKGMIMFCSTTRRSRLKPALLACAAGLSLLASPALAQQVDPAKLLELMVAKGLVSRSEADGLLAQSTTASPPAVPAGGVSGDVQTIPYIPATVRNQIKEELRGELASQAASEGWARPGEVAEWTKRLTLSGDIRVRGEGVRMEKANYPDFLNYGAINNGSGFNTNQASPGFVNPPFLNTSENRYRARIRARLGLKAQIDSWITGEVRIATGSDRSPVSTNQTLGGNGEFGKYAIWLDRANIRLTPVQGVDVAFGRFANPFWTTELLFDDDLNFDGLAASVAAPVNEHLTLFGTAGVFPIFNTDFNFGSNDAGAFSSKDKYLLAGQVGVEFKPADDVTLKLAGGYFRFENAQGEFSSPCAFNQDVCDTDVTRPQFQQFGNTLFPIRNITDNPGVPPGASPTVQYFGLAPKYEILNAHGALDLGFFNPIGIRVNGDYVKNLGFKRSQIAPLAVNNFGPDVTVGGVTTPGQYVGGDTGWSANLIVGKPDLIRTGDWNVSLGYRRLESDAVLDAFTDSDFHFGGTNAKGFIIGGAYAFGKNTTLGGRWLSADSISGEPYSNDVIQIDLTTRF